MNLINKTGSEKIDAAISIFKERIRAIVLMLGQLDELSTPFTYSNYCVYQVRNAIEAFLSSEMDIEIALYKSKNPYSSAIGFYAGGNVIYINSRKLDSFSDDDYAGTIAHELMHVIGFSHGNNYVDSNKLKSIPYSIGRIVSGESNFPFSKEPEIKLTYKKPWWKFW